MKVGDKAKGFKFEDGVDGVEFYSEKEHYIGKEGFVKYIRPNYFAIQFEGDYWEYPISLAHLSVVDEWQPKQGEMIEVSNDGKGFDKAKFIGMDNGYFICNYDYFTYTYYQYARPINPIQREIDELQAKIDELKKRL